MSSLKLSLCKLLQLSSAVYLTKRSTPEHYFQFLRLVEQYPGSQLHANRLSTKVVTVSKAYLSNPTKGKKKIFSEMDCDQSKSGDGTLSKRAQKRLARCQKHKEQMKQPKAEQRKMAQKDDAGYNIEDFHQSTYYFENGFRKVYPYTFTFATYAKGRWVGRTIKDVLEKEFGFDQPEDLIKSFDVGHIHVNSQQVGPNYVVRDCDHISHQIHRHENPVTWAPLEIIKNTEDLIVINKPSSIPCHPCGRYRFNSIVFILGKEMGFTNLRNIYRLDRLTSGVLMLAKTTETTKTLEDQVAKRQVQKEYVCRVAGKFPQGPVKVDQPLRPLSNKLRLQIVCPTGKASQTEFELISYNGKSSVVKCRPYTGRTHQIRVHLQYLGHPIINDAFYNNAAWGPGNGKGGNYEVPFEEVCARILKEHHANLWNGGENPLYFEKIREMEEREATSKTTKDEVTTSVSTLDKSVDCSAAAAAAENLKDPAGQKDSNLTDTESRDSDTEPPSKKLKAEENGNANELKRSPSPEFTKNQVTTSFSNGDVIHQCENSTKDILSSYSDPAKIECRTAGASESDKDLATTMATVQTDEHEDHEVSQTCKDGRPGFEMSQWSVDKSCELCKKLPVEPREKDMVMFLHALKYKGPGWEYETSLPDWAKPDWSLEEDFVDKESASFR